MAELYFITNRAHKGLHWKPTGYSGEFSHDKPHNLRYGKVNLKLNNEILKKCINQQRGDKIVAHIEDVIKINNKSKKSYITAYEESIDKGEKPLPSEIAFKEVKSKMATGKDCLFFVHGFNTNWEESVATALSLQIMLNQETDVMVVLFSWPSDGKFYKYWSDYDEAEMSSDAASRAMQRLKYLFYNVSKGDICDRKMYILCHSMGNFVFQKAFEKISKKTRPLKLKPLFEHIFMCAADVDDTVLEKKQPLGKVNQITRYLTVYFNDADRALAVSEVLKHPTDRLGDGGFARPRGNLHNKYHQVDCEFVAKYSKHGYFLNRQTIKDIRQSIMGYKFDNSERLRERINYYHNTWRLT